MDFHVFDTYVKANDGHTMHFDVITDKKNNEEAISFAEELKSIFVKEGIRVALDIRNEKIGYKIREHSNAKTQLMAIIGKKEVEEEKISIRNLRRDQNDLVKKKEKTF